jgi:hypothetical protein
MTEAGKRWAVEVQDYKKVFDLSGVHPLDSSVAEFWVRAFCQEVERRAQELCKDHAGFFGTNGITCSSSKGQALSELRRELLGE